MAAPITLSRSACLYIPIVTTPVSKRQKIYTRKYVGSYLLFSNWIDVLDDNTALSWIFPRAAVLEAISNNRVNQVGP